MNSMLMMKNFQSDKGYLNFHRLEKINNKVIILFIIYSELKATDLFYNRLKCFILLFIYLFSQ